MFAPSATGIALDPLSLLSYYNYHFNSSLFTSKMSFSFIGQFYAVYVSAIVLVCKAVSSFKLCGV